MVSLLLRLVSRSARDQGHVHAATVQPRFGVRDGHIHIVDVLNGHTTGGQVSRQQLVKVGSRRARYRLSLQALRACQAVVLCVHGKCLGGAAVHVEHLDIRTVGRGQDHRGGSHRVKHLHVAGSQGLSLIRPGIDLRVLHGNSHFPEVVRENVLIPLNDGGYV